MLSLTDLYKRDPLPPHCYLVYDLIYEFSNIDLILGIQGDVIMSYILIWRSPRIYGIHLWRPNMDMISRLTVPADRVAYVHIYEGEEKHVALTENRLKEIGYSKIERRIFYNMVCDESTFTPSINEGLAIKLQAQNQQHLELFLNLKRSRGQELTLEEAMEILRRRRYYGIIVDGVLTSTSSRYLALQEIHMIGDVYTKPEYRGRGYAKAVTSAITREAIVSGALSSLHVEATNEPAIKVYRGLGYRTTKIHHRLEAFPR
jgi:GNAT superfamily N-acetyltransferase